MNVYIASMIKKHNTYLVLFLLIALVSVLITGCGTQSSQKPETKQPEKASKQSVDDVVKTADNKQAPSYQPVENTSPKLIVVQKGVSFKWIDKGVVRMSAAAKEISGNEMQKVGTLVDFSAQLYEDGKLIGSITAPKAVADAENRTVTATGGVTLKSTEHNTVIKSSWMKWYVRQQKIVGNGGVNATSTMGTMEGAAFVADTGMKNIKILSSSKGLLP